MVDSERQILNNYYDSIRRLLQITEGYYSSFDIAFIETDKIESEIKKSILKAIRKIQIDLFSALDLIDIIQSTENEFELQKLLDKQQEHFEEVS
ncbi:MAG: hypothetical protein IPH11_04835 [Ignavibacteriales bacterium]|nr:hypothetical protein [Ignavibacteriales bacterium]